MRAYVADEQAILIHAASGWVNLASALALQNLPRLGVLTAADSINRLAVKSDAVLLSHDDVTPGSGDLRVALNKRAAANDASLVFQDSFAPRALFGLLGDDDLAVKVTPDGSQFVTALVIDHGNGRPRFPAAPKFSAWTDFDNHVPANAWTKVQFNHADPNEQNAFSAASNNFTAPFAGAWLFGFSLRFRRNGAAPTRAVVAFHKNGAELGRGRAVSAAPEDDVTIWSLAALTPLAQGDVIDVRVHFATNDGYVKADQSHFWGCYVP